MSRKVPPEPWNSFLAELDTKLHHALELICMGGFVATVQYGVPRETADIDCLEIRTEDPGGETRLVELAREGSLLYQKHKLYLDLAGSITNYPDSYADRLAEMFPDAFRHLRLFALDPYDLVLSKLERSNIRDRQDVRHIAKTVPLIPEILKERYRTEMRPYLARPEREDLTLELWIEEFFPEAG